MLFWGRVAAVGATSCFLWAQDADAFDATQAMSDGFSLIGFGSSNPVYKASAVSLDRINGSGKVAAAVPGMNSASPEVRREAIVGSVATMIELTPIGLEYKGGEFALGTANRVVTAVTGVNPLNWVSSHTVGAWLDGIERDRQSLAQWNEVLRQAHMNDITPEKQKILNDSTILMLDNIQDIQKKNGIVPPKLAISTSATTDRVFSGVNIRLQDAAPSSVPSSTKEPGSAAVRPSPTRPPATAPPASVPTTPPAREQALVSPQAPGGVGPSVKAPIAPSAKPSASSASAKPQGAVVPAAVGGVHGDSQKPYVSSIASSQGGVRTAPTLQSDKDGALRIGGGDTKTQVGTPAAGGIHADADKPYVSSTALPQGGVRVAPTLQPDRDGALRIGGSDAGVGAQSAAGGGAGQRGVAVAPKSTGNAGLGSAAGGITSSYSPVTLGPSASSSGFGTSQVAAIAATTEGGVHWESSSPYVSDMALPQGGLRVAAPLQPDSEGALRLGGSGAGADSQSGNLSEGNEAGIRIGAYQNQGTSSLGMEGGTSAGGVNLGGLNFSSLDITAATGRDPVIQQSRVIEPTRDVPPQTPRPAGRNAMGAGVESLGGWAYPGDGASPPYRSPKTPFSPQQQQQEAAAQAFMGALVGAALQGAISGAISGSRSHGGGGYARGGGGYGNSCAGGSSSYVNGQEVIRWWCLTGH